MGFVGALEVHLVHFGQQRQEKRPNRGEPNKTLTWLQKYSLMIIMTAVCDSLVNIACHGQRVGSVGAVRWCLADTVLDKGLVEVF